MKRLPDAHSGSAVVELLVAIVIVGILIYMAIPKVGCSPDRSRMTQTLANARSLQQATQMMTLDQIETPGGALIDWTSVKSRSLVRPLPLATYFDALVKNGYVTPSELRELLTAPEAPHKGPGKATPTAENICFTFFQVSSESPNDQPMIVTANWKNREMTDNEPYLKKGFVVFNKGGGGGVYKRTQDASSTNIFPVGRSESGASYRYVPLK